MRIVPPTVRWASGLLAVTGAVFLPSLVCVMFIPGGIIWVFWVLNAMGKPWANVPAFWVFSLLWNLGWAVAFFLFFGDPGSNPILIVAHCGIAAVVSACALACARAASGN